MFNTSDLAQLTGVSKTLRNEILEIMAASAEPMTCHDIMLASTLCPDRESMTREVFAMKKAGLVEPAGETKRPGTPRPVWLYQLTANAGSATQESEEPVTAENKEKTMQLETEQAAAPKVTTKHIRDLVIAHPGIKRDDVYQALVFSDGSNKKKVGDLISALISTKHLNQTDEGGIKRLHPGERLNDVLAGKRARKPKAEATVKAPVARLLTGEEARPFQQETHAAPTANGESDIPSIPEFLRKKAQPTAPTAGDTQLINYLSAVAAAIPPGVVLGICKDKGGSTEIAFDTDAGACFNVGGSFEDAVRCIDALAVVQAFAED